MMFCLTSHCGRPALVNISSITRDRPAGKKLQENGFSKVSKQLYRANYLMNIKKSTMTVVTAKVASNSSLL